MTFRFNSRRRASNSSIQNHLAQAIFQKNIGNLPKLVTIGNLPSSNALNEKINFPLQAGPKKPSTPPKSTQKEPVVDNEVSKFLSISANRNCINGEVNIPNLPPLPSPNDPSFDKIFKQKIEVCNLIFNFNQPQAQVNAKKVKLNALIEINKLMLKDSDVSLITSKHKDMIFDMIMNNIFKQDPFISNDSLCASTLNLSIVEPSWEHMCHVYQAFIQFIIIYPESCQIDLVKNMIRLLNIPDNNERENLMTLLQNYSRSHKNQVEEIIKLLKSALINVICNIYTPYCVEPVLSFLKILVGTEYLSTILYTHLLPLYRHEKLYLYSNKLTNIIVQILETKCSEHIRCIEYFLNYFPRQCSSKQCIFIYSLNSIFNIIIGQELKKIGPKLISFFSKLVDSPNSKLADPALKILLKPAMSSIIFNNPIMANDYLQGPLKWSSIYHWDKSVKILSGKALATLINTNYDSQKKSHSFASQEGTSFNENILLSKNQSRIIDNTELISKWALVARSAARRDNSIDLTKSLLLIQSNLLNEGSNFRK